MKPSSSLAIVEETSLKESFLPFAAFIVELYKYYEAFIEVVCECRYPAPTPDLNQLDAFDRIAGELMSEYRIGNRISSEALSMIAKTLDANSFELSKCLQAAQWKPIANHNQKSSRSAIKTFEAAIAKGRFSREVRKRLSLSYQRYSNTLNPPQRKMSK